MKLILPTSITFPRKTKTDKKYMLNLNVYRNLNYIVNNQMKAAFADEIARLNSIPKPGQLLMSGTWVIVNDLHPFREYGIKPPYRFTYTLFQESKRKTDVANVCCVVDKFCCDSLVSLGVLPDDNHNIIKEVVYRYGGVDKDKPRVELQVEAI